MTIGFEPESDNVKIQQINDKMDEILDSQLVPSSGNAESLLDSTLGRRNSASGESGGIRSNQPLIHQITDVNSAGVSTGVFDKINIISSMAIIDYSATPITLRFIQGDVKPGTRIKVTPKLAKSINIETGGNILTLTTIAITDTQYYELVKYSEAETGVVGGAWKVLLSGSGGGGSTPPFVDSDPLVKGSVDAGKLLRFEVDGFAAPITRVLTPQDADYTIAGLELSQTWSGNNTFTGAILNINSATINLGDASTDVINFLGRSGTNLVPIVNSTHNLGASGLQWNTLWIDTLQNATTVVVNSPNFAVNSSQITLGDAITDEITFLGRVGDLGILPINNSIANLGASGNQWNILWIDILQNASTVVVSSPNFAINSSQITLGDAITDEVSFLGRVGNVGITPINNSAANLGTTGFQWNTLWIDTLTNATTVAVTSPNFAVNSSQITFGDAITDEVSFLGRVGNLGIIPINNSAANLGASGKQWNTLWIDTLQNATTVVVSSPNFAINSSQITLGDSVLDNISFLGQVSNNIVMEEITLPGNALANTGRFYARDVAGNAVPFWKDESGTEFNMIAGGVSLSANNTWTGIQTFTGSTFNVNTTAINLGDATSDNVNVLGRINTNLDPSGDGTKNMGTSALEWNTIFVRTLNATATLAVTSPNFAINSAQITLGDSTSDDINFLGRVSTDIDPDGDGTRSMGSSALEWSTLFVRVLNATSTLAVTSPNFAVNSAQITLGDAVSDDVNILGTVASDVLIEGGKRLRSSNSTEIGYYVTNATSSIGTAGTNQIPVVSSLTPTVANLDAAFGSEIGCMGVYNTGASSVVLAFKNQSSEWIVIACPDAGGTVISDHIN